MVTKQQRPTRYIIMPSEGFTDSRLLAPSLALSNHQVAVTARAAAVIRPRMRVLDTIRENGPKLVEMPPEGELSLRLDMPGIKIVPEVFYQRQWYRPQVERAPTRGHMAARMTAASAGTRIQVVDRASGKALRGATVIAITDSANNYGAKGSSDNNGHARITGISSGQKLDRLYVYGPPGYWGFYRSETTIAANSKIKLRAVELQDSKLLLRQLYGTLTDDAGAGVTVGIIDTGVDARHPDLSNVTGGLNCVTDETRGNPAAEAEWRPAKKQGEHGTHVAGIVAARGGPSGFRGVAPGADLRAYRVFPDIGGGASNYDIAKAIDRATVDDCLVLNLSLGGGPADDLTRAAISRAVAAGVVVICAAGNDDHSPVSYPAAYPESTAVSAMGRRDSFPKESTGTADIDKPFGDPNKGDFVAAFSNYGSQIDCTGAGVEIVSTLPGGKYGPMSGTSMATPAVAGFAAHLLSANPSIRNMSGVDRSRALKDLLYSRCKPEGFGRDWEGFGLPSI